MGSAPSGPLGPGGGTPNQPTRFSLVPDALKGLVLGMLYEYNWFTDGAALLLLLGMAWLSWLLGAAADTVTNAITGGWLGKKHKVARSGDTPPEEIPYSLIGQLDSDFSFVNGDALLGGGDATFPTPAPLSRPNAEFLAMAANLSYEDHRVVRDIVDNHWARGGPVVRFKAGFVFQWYKSSNQKPETRDLGVVILSVTPPGDGRACLVVAFRGTEPLTAANWEDDLTALPERGSTRRGQWLVHPGFLNALGLDADLEDKRMTVCYKYLGPTLPNSGVDPNPGVDHPDLTKVGTCPFAIIVAAIDALRSAAPQDTNAAPKMKIYITGHSLGGALATMFSAALALRYRDRADDIGACYTFGQPRVGDFRFMSKYESLMQYKYEYNTNRAVPPAGDGDGGANRRRRQVAASTSAAAAPAGTAPAPADPTAVAGTYSSKHVRVVHSNDVVCTVPPTFNDAYQHAGELVLLEGVPGKVKLLMENRRLYYWPMWWFSVQKLIGYGRLNMCSLLCTGPRMRRDSLLRLAGRVAATVPLLHAYVAGVNDHAPGDYYWHIALSSPADWRPFVEEAPQWTPDQAPKQGGHRCRRQGTR